MYSKTSFLFLFLIACRIWGFSQTELSGKVTDSKTGEPLPGATLFIPDLKTGVAAGTDGSYHLGNLPRSILLVQASFIGYGSLSSMIDLTTTTSFDFALPEKAIEAMEVVISGSGISTDNSRSSIAITPISRMELLTTPSTNIIDAISAVPGLSEITTGGDISKPVIRGLGYNHVVTLNDGVRQEGQQWGDEHGIEIDQFSADRIEVLKGPASLFYGSDAMGGVINILEPIHAPLNTIRGQFNGQFATNNRMPNGSLMIEGNQGGFTWRARASYKNAASYKSPPEFVYNSCFHEMNYSAMLGLNKRWGFSHLHFSRYDATIGMVEGERDSLTGRFINPDGLVVSDQEVMGRHPAAPYQNVRHTKVSSVSNFISGASQVRVNIGYQVNDRREFSLYPGNPSLYMHLNTGTGDIKFTHLFPGNTECVSGLAGMLQTNLNRGEEFLAPDYSLGDFGLFAYVKKSWPLFTLNGGIRFDVRQVRGKSLCLDSLGNPAREGTTLFPGFNRTFSSLSGSAGFTCAVSKTLNVKFNIGSGFRAPNIAELGSNGVHEGTFRYEIGNPMLKPENSLQTDGEIAAIWDRIRIAFNGYVNYIAHYIYERNDHGETISVDGTDYRVYRFVQGNSLLKGFELEADFHPLEQLHFDNSIDYVVGTNLTTGTPLPFIPALHSVHTLRWTIKTGKTSRLSSPYLELGGQFQLRQDRIDPFETPTPGYFLLDASAGTKVRLGRQWLTLFISGNNLTNTKYFDHLSRLKEVGVYNPGWNVVAGIVLPFGIYDGN